MRLRCMSESERAAALNASGFRTTVTSKRLFVMARSHLATFFLAGSIYALSALAFEVPVYDTGKLLRC